MESLEAMSEQASVSCLSVACVEAVLEHGSFDVVPLVLLFWRKALDLAPELRASDLLLVEVAPRVRRLDMREVYSPVFTIPLVLSHINSIEYLASLCICDFKVVCARLSLKQVSASSLQLAREQFHSHVEPCKLTVLRTLVCAVGIYVLHYMACHSLRIGYGILQEVTISKSRRSCLY